MSIARAALILLLASFTSLANPEGERGITLQIDKVGKISTAGGEVLTGEKAAEEFLTAQRNKHLQNAATPYLYLISAEGTEFRHVRQAIRAASNCGIVIVVFRPRGKEAVPANPGPQKECRVRLPSVLDDRPPLSIWVDAENVVSVGTGAAAEKLDANDAGLPLLTRRVKTYVSAAELGGTKPSVEVEVNDQASYGRILEVLEVLRSCKVSEVIFAYRHWEEEE